MSSAVPKVTALLLTLRQTPALFPFLSPFPPGNKLFCFQSPGMFSVEAARGLIQLRHKLYLSLKGTLD